MSDVGAWARNVVSSVSLIMANKQLMSSSGYAFAFATTLTGFHFTVTTLVGWISNAIGYSVSKHVPLWELVWFSLVTNTSTTGMNLSLMLNSVGFYQISKLSMIPVVCLMEWVLNSKHYTLSILKLMMVREDGEVLPEFVDADEEKLYDFLNIQLESDLNLKRNCRGLAYGGTDYRSNTIALARV